QCVAQAGAGEVEKAFAAAQRLESDPSMRNKVQEGHFIAAAYARVARAAARAGKADVFRKCYLSSHAHLAYLTARRADGGPGGYARSLLAEADVYAGNLERAWVGALNVPDPRMQAQALLAIAYGRAVLRRAGGADLLSAVRDPEARAPLVR